MNRRTFVKVYGRVDPRLQEIRDSWVEVEYSCVMDSPGVGDLLYAYNHTFEMARAQMSRTTPIRTVEGAYADRVLEQVSTNVPYMERFISDAAISSINNMLNGALLGDNSCTRQEPGCEIVSRPITPQRVENFANRDDRTDSLRRHAERLRNQLINSERFKKQYPDAKLRVEQVDKFIDGLRLTPK